MPKPVSESSYLPLPAESCELCLQALRLLSASLQRSANKAYTPEIRAIYERDKSRVEALIASFR